MQRIGVVLAVVLSTLVLIGYVAAAHSGTPGVVAAQTAPAGGGTGSAAGGMAPSPGGTGGGMSAAPMGGGAAMGAPAGAEAAAGPAAPTLEPRTVQVGEDEDVVKAVIDGGMVKLQNRGVVHLAGVVTPKECFVKRSDYAAYEGEHEPGDWRRFNGWRYFYNEVPDEYCYNVGEEELRLFVHKTVVNKVVQVTELGEYTLSNGNTIPDVELTFTRPQILVTDSTDPINLNEMVIAESHNLGLLDCRWNDGYPTPYDIHTQAWSGKPAEDDDTWTEQPRSAYSKRKAPAGVSGNRPAPDADPMVRPGARNSRQGACPMGGDHVWGLPDANGARTCVKCEAYR